VVGLPIVVGGSPRGVAVTPDGRKVYVTNAGNDTESLIDDTVSVIDTETDDVVATITINDSSFGVAVTPDGSKVYVTNLNRPTVSVIDTGTNTVVALIGMGVGPRGVAVTPDGSKVYVANPSDNRVAVIDTEFDTLVATIQVGTSPIGVAVTPDGSRVYVANQGSNTVSVIDTADNTVAVLAIPVGDGPRAFGLFIHPAKPLFAGTVGQATRQSSASLRSLSFCHSSRWKPRLVFTVTSCSATSCFTHSPSTQPGKWTRPPGDRPAAAMASSPGRSSLRNR
jgi:YVTN family beta-propeller protein